MKKLSSLFLLCLCALALSVSAAADSLPGWYPADPSNFQFFHDETAPRVVDDADLFTDEEESRMETRLAQLRRELDRDVVIYTDVSSYGMECNVLAADFYDFNGYGCGDEREGVCLFVCMEEGNRGWFACCTGSDTMERYTEAVADQIDDALYEYMAAGDYAEGVENWIENIRDMYLAEPPEPSVLPDWYPADTGSFQRFHNENAPRVVDEAGLLSASEISALTAKAADVSAKYGVDVLILTTNGNELVNDWAYQHDYYVYNGYGFGRNYDGIQLTAFPHLSGCTISGYGAVEEKLTTANLDRMQSRWDDERTYYGAMNAWLDQADHMLKTGRVPRSAGSWGLTAFLGALFGSAFGGATLGSAKHKMRAPRVSRGADAYIAANGTRISAVRDDYLYTTSSRCYSPPPQERDSGGSDFSGSFSGSSGATHSGSGRDF